MAHRLLAVLYVLVSTALLLSLCGCEHNRSQTSAPVQRVTIAGRTFNLELAINPEARYRGLSDRAEIAADEGMLFVFPGAGVQTFVMRRCLVPIDVVFLGPGGRIVAMHEMAVEPYDTPDDQLKPYSSQWPAQFVIEFKGGTIRALGLREGQKIEFPIDSLKARAT